MPNTHNTLGSLFNDIADAIRAKDGTSAEIVADTFPDRINAIDTDPSSDATINSNGQLLSGVTAYGQGVKYTGTIPTKTNSDLSASGDTVTVPAGYYASQATKSVATGSATTPADSITSNPTITFNSTTGKIEALHSGSKSITPTVSAGYISSGTAGTVSTSGSASVTPSLLDADLAAGNIKTGVNILGTAGTFTNSNTITGSGKSAAVAGDILSGKAAFLDGTQLNGTMTNNGATGGIISTQGGTYTIPAGYTSGGTVTASLPAMTLPTAVAAAADGTNKATISRSTSDQYINIPTGYNSAKGSYKINAVANGSATTPATSVSPGAGTGSVASSTGIVTITAAQNTKSVTPTVSAGYISSGTAGTITVPQTSFTYQLPTTKAAATITPGTTNQTIAAGTYLTGIQTIAGDADLVAGNIKKNVNIFGVVGTYEGADTSDATATAADIVSGKTAYISTGKVTGTLAIYDGTVIVN